MVCDTLPSQDASTYQIWDAYLKKCMGYDPDTIVLETRSGVKVTMTQKWYTTHCHPKIHPHTKFWISTSNTIILETRSKVNVTVTQKCYVTLAHPKMHPHTKFGTPTSNYIGDMAWTRKRY